MKRSLPAFRSAEAPGSRIPDTFVRDQTGAPATPAYDVYAATVNIIEPSPAQATARVTCRCRG